MKEKISTSIHIILVLIAASFLSSCSVATVTIPAHQEFVLGETEKSGFTAKVHNLSKEQVDVVIIDTETKVQTQGFGLSGKGSARVWLSKRETLLLKNPHDKEVKVRAKLNKDVQGMRYQAVNSTSQKEQ